MLAVDGVSAASPFIEMEGMVRTGRYLHPVMVHGVDPVFEQSVSRWHDQLPGWRSRQTGARNAPNRAWPHSFA